VFVPRYIIEIVLVGERFCSKTTRRRNNTQKTRFVIVNGNVNRLATFFNTQIKVYKTALLFTRLPSSIISYLSIDTYFFVAWYLFKRLVNNGVLNGKFVTIFASYTRRIQISRNEIYGLSGSLRTYDNSYSGILKYCSNTNRRTNISFRVKRG